MSDETDKCRASIRRLFNHSPEYNNYIETKLAGDFACKLSLIVKRYDADIKELADALNDTVNYISIVHDLDVLEEENKNIKQLEVCRTLANKHIKDK